MIEEEAYVAEVQGGRVWIEKDRGAGCAGCAQACPGSLAGRGTPARLAVDSDLSLHPGDKVLVGIAEEALAAASLLVYLLPLLGLFGGALLGKAAFGSDLASASGALAGFGLCLAGLKAARLGDRAGQRPVILRKID